MIFKELTSDVPTGVPYKRKRRGHRHRRKLPNIVVFICLFLAAFGTLVSAIGYLALDGESRQYRALAESGAQDLQAAIADLQAVSHDPLNTRAIADAQRRFTEAQTTFTQVDGVLSKLPDALTAVPRYGALISAARHVVPLAIEAAQAGLIGCNMWSTVVSRFQQPLDAKAQGLGTSDMLALNKGLKEIELILAQAVRQVDQLQPDDLQLDPRLSKIVGEFRSGLPAIEQGISTAEGFFSIAPGILGTGQPAYYLAEILDSSELRPGGGFIGNYGIVELSGGRLESARVIDTYLLDRAFERTHSLPFPSVYSWFTLSPGRWGLRDSNLDADFPTSARDAEMHYTLEGGKLHLAGVMAFTPAFIQRILTLTGPINVPEYQETVTAQNLVDRIHFHQLIEEGKNQDVPSADGYSSQRKHFTALLGEQLLGRIHNLPRSILPRLVQVFLDSLRTKDIQLYFNSDPAEKVLNFYHFEDRIQPPGGDGIFVVDTNLALNKANSYLLTTVDDKVTIDKSGNATHSTQINFKWTTQGLSQVRFYGSKNYKGYVRVYLPPNSALQAQGGWTPYDRGTAHGSRFWGGYFQVDYPLQGTITLTWSVAGAARNDGHSWYYSYLIQRQAGAQQQVSLQVGLPSCGAITASSKGFMAEGPHRAQFTNKLDQDTKLNITYSC